MQIHFSEVFEYLNICVCLFSFVEVSMHSNDCTSLYLNIFPPNIMSAPAARLCLDSMWTLSERLVSFTWIISTNNFTIRSITPSDFQITIFVSCCYVRLQGCQWMDWLIVVKGQVNSSSAVFMARTILETINRVDKKKMALWWNYKWKIRLTMENNNVMECGKSLSYNGPSLPISYWSLGADSRCIVRARCVTSFMHGSLFYAQS